MARTWNDDYVLNETPWDTGDVDPNLIEFFTKSANDQKHRVLDIGCGAGTQALWVAEHGHEVLGLDLAPAAIEKANKAAADRGLAGNCRFLVHDILTHPLEEAGFSIVFDRGCFHVFDEAKDRALFAQRVAEVLAPRGRWLSLIGSTEGPAREHGPPRRSARDIIQAIEPVLEIVDLSSRSFPMPNFDLEVRAWSCVAQAREVPAQPSTAHPDGD